MHLSRLILWYDNLSVTKTHVVSIAGHEKQTDMQNNQYLEVFSIITNY